jgi:hypothetical protein
MTYIHTPVSGQVTVGFSIPGPNISYAPENPPWELSDYVSIIF